MSRFSGIGFWVNKSLYETGFQTYLDSLVTPLSGLQKQYLNDFYVGIKDDFDINLLSEIADQILNLAGETEESSLKNLVKRAHDATLSTTAPTYTQYEGFKGNGTSAYIDTNWNGRTAGHAVAYSLNSASFGIYFRSNINSAIAELHGTWSTTPDGGVANRIQLSRPNGASINYTLGLNSGVETYLATAERINGMYIGARTAGDLQKSYLNSVEKVSGIASTTKIPNQNVLLLAVYNIVSATQYFENDQISFSILGRGFSQTEVGYITNRFETYMDKRGKGVI